MSTESIKICLTSSAGGHLSQLLKLVESWNGYNSFCVTTTKHVQAEMAKYGTVYIVGESNYKHLLRVLKVFFRCMHIVLKEKPNVVISTGAAAGCIMCYLGKLFGAKVVWLDSITNVERMSLSGRLVRPIADLLLVQWPALVSKYKNAEYLGTVI